MILGDVYVEFGDSSYIGFFTARLYASAVYAVIVCPSVRLSVKRQYCIKTVKRKQRHMIGYGLVFRRQRSHIL